MSDNPVLEPAQFYESELKPTDEAEVTTAQETEQDVELETQAPKEEPKGEVVAESEASEDDEEPLYIDLDGKEVDLAEIREWRDHGLMQSDYTKKTTALSTERKTFEDWRSTERDTITQERAKLTEQTDLLDVLVKEDEQINWVELKEDDPERYIELKEKADNRKAALEQVKADRSIPADDPAFIQAEAQKLFDANPTWMEDGKITEAYKQDTALMDSYSRRAGFTTDEFKQMTRSHYLMTILKAAKYDELQEKARQTKETRVKVPVIPKPKAETKPAGQEVDAASQLYGNSNGA